VGFLLNQILYNEQDSCVNILSLLLISAGRYLVFIKIRPILGKKNNNIHKRWFYVTKFYVILDFINFNCDKVARETERPGTK
jgi:hypothetical protein